MTDDWHWRGYLTDAEDAALAAGKLGHNEKRDLARDIAKANGMAPLAILRAMDGKPEPDGVADVLAIMPAVQAHMAAREPVPETRAVDDGPPFTEHSCRVIQDAYGAKFANNGDATVDFAAACGRFLKVMERKQRGQRRAWKGFPVSETALQWQFWRAAESSVFEVLRPQIAALPENDKTRADLDALCVWGIGEGERRRARRGTRAT